MADAIESIDLLTMQRKLVARNTWGPPSGGDGSTIYAYSDRERRLHLSDITGQEIKALGTTSRAPGIIVSEDKHTFGVLGDNELAVYDATGSRRMTYQIRREAPLIMLRGDEAWLGSTSGVLRHYKDEMLVASTPAHIGELAGSALARNMVGLITNDGGLVLVRATAQHVKFDGYICDGHPAYSSLSIASAYFCGANTKLWVGRKHIADYPGSEPEIYLAVERNLEHSAVSGPAGIQVYDRDAKIVAKSPRTGAISFDDSEHLWILVDRNKLRRWTIGTDTWEDIMPVAESYSLQGLRGGTVVVGTSDGKLLVIENRHEVKRVDVGEQVADMTESVDGHWLAVNLANGATSIVDTRTWQVVRRLATADNYGAAPTFDATGDLLLRTSRSALSIWDRATGEELVYSVDLLQDLSNGRFLPDGRIELDQRQPGLLDIPRDTRPVEQILADIDCKVPLKVVGSRIEPQIPRCP
jgi:hypothetical protein